MRKSSITVLVLVATMAAIFLFPALSIAGTDGSVSVSASIGPCLRVTSGGEILSNVSASTFTDPNHLTVIAR